MAETKELRVVSLNVRGLNNHTKRHTIYKWIRKNDYGICFLQETFCISNLKQQFQKGWNGDIFHSFSDSSHSRGVCIMLHNNISYKSLSSYSDEEGRIMLVNIEIGSHNYALLNIYAPCNIYDRIRFFFSNDYVFL